MSTRRRCLTRHAFSIAEFVVFCLVVSLLTVTFIASIEADNAKQKYPNLPPHEALKKFRADKAVGLSDKVVIASAKPGEKIDLTPKPTPPPLKTKEEIAREQFAEEATWIKQVMSVRRETRSNDNRPTLARPGWSAISFENGLVHLKWHSTVVPFEALSLLAGVLRDHQAVITCAQFNYEGGPAEYTVFVEHLDKHEVPVLSKPTTTLTTPPRLVEKN